MTPDEYEAAKKTIAKYQEISIGIDRLVFDVSAIKDDQLASLLVSRPGSIHTIFVPDRIQKDLAALAIQILEREIQALYEARDSLMIPEVPPQSDDVPF